MIAYDLLENALLVHVYVSIYSPNELCVFVNVIQQHCIIQGYYFYLFFLYGGVKIQ